MTGILQIHLKRKDQFLLVTKILLARYDIILWLPRYSVSMVKHAHLRTIQSAPILQKVVPDNIQMLRIKHTFNLLKTVLVKI